MKVLKIALIVLASLVLGFSTAINILTIRRVKVLNVLIALNEAEIEAMKSSQEVLLYNQHALEERMSFLEDSGKILKADPCKTKINVRSVKHEIKP